MPHLLTPPSSIDTLILSKLDGHSSRKCRNLRSCWQQKSNGLSIQRLVVFFTRHYCGSAVSKGHSIPNPAAIDIVCDYMCKHPVNDNFWIIPSMRLLIHRRYDLGGRDPLGRFWHRDACGSTRGFGWICLHEDLKRTCHWLGVTRKYDASYESVKRNINHMTICFKHLWLHVLPLLWGHFNSRTTGFECSKNSRSGNQENSATPGSAETCPTEGQGHLAYSFTPGVPARVFPRVEFVRDSWLTFGIIYFNYLRFVAIDSES